jgi:hypothetical protein
MLNQTKVRRIAEEFGIHLILHYIDDDTLNPTENHNTSRQIRESNKTCSFDYKYEVEMNLYKGHVFLEERSEISAYYINHIETEPFEKRRFHKKGSHYVKLSEEKY